MQEPASVFAEPNVLKKIELLPARVNWCLNFQSAPVCFEGLPARDVPVALAKDHPKKKSISLPEGQARLLHDLASIELQAMELGLRTLEEFPEAPKTFREELAALTLSEAKHLELCLRGVESLGFEWGQWPVHLALWSACSVQDTLLERIFIVHRYLEGSGLDASASILNKLSGLGSTEIQKIVEVIRDEEVDHVAFGSRWFRHFIEPTRSSEEVFLELCYQVSERLPNRFEPPNREWRIKAGFSPEEIDAFEKYQNFRKQPREERRIV